VKRDHFNRTDDRQTDNVQALHHHELVYVSHITIMYTWYVTASKRTGAKTNTIEAITGTH